SAVEDIKDGMTIMVGGFGIVGIPENLIKALQKKGTGNLTVISNNCGIDGWGLGLLLEGKQISKMIASYVGENKEFERQYLIEDLVVEVVLKVCLAEKIRACIAGIHALYTPAGVGTRIAEGKETKTFGDKEYLLEEALTADVSLVRAWKADKMGNLVYRKTAQNFNPNMATAGAITIAEVEEIVEVGELDPDKIDKPSIYVQGIVQGDKEKRMND